MDKAGEGKFLFETLLSMVPCYIPICSAKKATNINQRLGGDDDCFKRGVCHFCCTPCAICELARAVNAASEKGLLKSGAPQEEEEMTH